MGKVVRADAERAAAQDRLRRAERMESLVQLVGGIAHDFNNLLNVIGAFSDMVAEEIAGLAAQDARLDSVLGDIEQIRGAAQRATRLIRQLLIFARTESTRSPASAAPSATKLNPPHPPAIRDLPPRFLGAPARIAFPVI